MIDNLDFSKVKNSHIKPLDFEVIEKAMGGELKSINEVIGHYQPYLRELATRTDLDEFGKKRVYIDETLRCQLENRLIKSVLAFKIQP